MFEGVSAISGPLYLSIKLAFFTTLFIPLVALPLAWLFAFRRFRGKSLAEAFVALPMVLPPTVLGFWLLIVMGPNGFIGQAWDAAFGQRLIFSFPAILLASIVYNMPFAVQPLRATFEKMDHRLLECSAVLGLTPLQAFRRVVLPNSLPGLAASSVLVFAHSLGEFGVILMVGGSMPGSTKVASIAIYEAVEALRYDDAFLLCLALVPASFIVLLAVNRMNRSLQ
ncbi:molybdate ABC transporter permease subunit [Oleidesulfovibrio sp.]|uniref:molybdate ABC transporter permease subunit n=1 Tax=Oleidesulfovibrio sp. TaxID=2909707 RepID=UPI003A8B708B